MPEDASEPAATDAEGGERPFRFFDNRQKYLMFVTTCTEKWVVADRIGMEIGNLRPRPPALRVFDGGVGDGTILSRVMRDLHRTFPTVPFVVVAKEISLEDVRLSLEKAPDRLAEHPATVMVFTNLLYAEAPGLTPSRPAAAEALNWHDIPLSGSSAADFDEQIKSLDALISDGWQVTASPTTGNPRYVKPTVLVLYRADHRFLLDDVIPQRGQGVDGYDLVIASQPFRARASTESKARNVLAPLARSLAPGGRMLTAYSIGGDPGMEIVQSVWPGEDPFQSNRRLLIKALKEELAADEPDLVFDALSDDRSLFNFRMHSLPDCGLASIGTSALMAAWNAAVYVAQIEDERLTEVMTGGAYLKAVEDVLKKHGGLWFRNESFLVTRQDV